MWQFPLPQPPSNLSVRPEDWFSGGTAFDSPEDLVLALQAMPEAPGSRKRLRRFGRRFFRGEPAAAVKSRSRLRSFIFALLVVAVPLVAAQATSRNAVTADLHVHHATGPGAKILAPSAVGQPSPQAGIASGSNGNTGSGNANEPSGNAVVAQVAGTSVGTGTQPTPPPAQGVSTPTPPPAAPVNLISNPSFESNSNGWIASGTGGGTIYRCGNCGPAEDGLWVMEVGPNYSVDTQYAIQTSPGYVGTAGHRYTASIWVRAYNTYTYGQTVTMGVSEHVTSGFNNGSVVQSPNTAITLSYTWQRVLVTVTQKNPGDSLVIYVSRVSKVGNEDFLVDNASLVAG
jgi:hypothetical protein